MVSAQAIWLLGKALLSFCQAFLEKRLFSSNFSPINPNLTTNKDKKREAESMTPPRIFSRKNRNDPWSLLYATKGHFCSLLISNIFCYPLFHWSTLRFISELLKHSLNLFSLMRIPSVFLFLLSAKGEFLTLSQRLCQHRSDLDSLSVLTTTKLICFTHSLSTLTNLYNA